MRVAIDNIDGPSELAAKALVIAQLLRQCPGPDRPDYWIAALDPPFTIVIDNDDREITHLVLAARWVGTAIGSGMTLLPVDMSPRVPLSPTSSSPGLVRQCRA
jgi:hypothetical protein